MPTYDADLAAVADDGWTVAEADPWDGDDVRREMGFSGFGVLTAPNDLNCVIALGRVTFTRGARVALSMSGALDPALVRSILGQFCQGDWGPDTPAERAAANAEGLAHDGEVAACYPVGYGVYVWVVSDGSRAATALVGAGEMR